MFTKHLVKRVIRLHFVEKKFRFKNAPLELILCQILTFTFFNQEQHFIPKNQRLRFENYRGETL